MIIPSLPLKIVMNILSQWFVFNPKLHYFLQREFAGVYVEVSGQKNINPHDPISILSICPQPQGLEKTFITYDLKFHLCVHGHS